MQHFMERALELARLAGELDEVPVGAVLVHEGKIIAEGSNERELSHCAIAHAEIRALQAYSARTGQWRLPPDTTLFVTLEPCLMCTGALIWARASHLVYGCADPKGAGLSSVLPLIEAGRFDHRFQTVTAGVLETQAAQQLKDFFAIKRKLKGNPTAGS